MREQSDTRNRIQAVALELFNEQGYEATSLREIAERLGVTKAALYYHFKTKEDIVGSLVQDRLDALAALVEWAESQPPGPHLREAVIRRYSDELRDARHHDAARFFERNHPDFSSITGGGAPFGSGKRGAGGGGASFARFAGDTAVTACPLPLPVAGALPSIGASPASCSIVTSSARAIFFAVLGIGAACPRNHFCT